MQQDPLEAQHQQAQFTAEAVEAKGKKLEAYAVALDEQYDAQPATGPANMIPFPQKNPLFGIDVA